MCVVWLVRYASRCETVERNSGPVTHLTYFTHTASHAPKHQTPTLRRQGPATQFLLPHLLSLHTLIAAKYRTASLRPASPSACMQPDRWSEWDVCDDQGVGGTARWFSKGIDAPFAAFGLSDF